MSSLRYYVAAAFTISTLSFGARAQEPHATPAAPQPSQPAIADIQAPCPPLQNSDAPALLMRIKDLLTEAEQKHSMREVRIDRSDVDEIRAELEQAILALRR
ncbi:MAG: hypothetical protein AUG75_17750 [Cyanobacteria bacterium 13_1_20CM_4_61_6]|nr:MAG: hypothetical protein AUG75_17750 [Cyanobacteria bacterium 13_1_20CM_4_61_6]